MSDLLDYAKDLEKNPENGVTPDEIFDATRELSPSGEIVSGIQYDPSKDPEYMAEVREARAARMRSIR